MARLAAQIMLCFRRVTTRAKQDVVGKPECDEDDATLIKYAVLSSACLSAGIARIGFRRFDRRLSDYAEQPQEPRAERKATATEILLKSFAGDAPLP